MPNLTFKKALASDGKYYDVSFTQVAAPSVTPPVVDPPVTPPVTPPDPPASSDEPNASTTGAKGDLTKYTGSYTPAAGTVIKDKILNNVLIVKAANVTVENCKITSSNYWGIDGEGSTNLKVRNTTITGTGNSCVLTGNNTLVEYCDLSGFDNGIMLSGVTATIQFNYIHDLHPGDVGEAHVDGIQMGGGQDGVLIKGNSIRSWDTSCIFMKCDWDANSPIRNVTIDGNWLRNQSGKQTAATIYAYSNKASVSNIVIKNNKIEPGYTGSLATDTSGARNAVTWTNNTHVSTGAAIPQP